HKQFGAGKWLSRGPLWRRIMPDGGGIRHRLGTGETRSRSGNSPGQLRQLGLGRSHLPEQVIHQQRIGQLQEPREDAALLRRGLRQLRTREALQEYVQLLHATAAPPQETAHFETPFFYIHQGVRSVAHDGTSSGAPPASS